MTSSSAFESDSISERVQSTELEVLTFDRDIAIDCGIPAAVLAKYFECSLRRRVTERPSRTASVWKTHQELARELGFTVKQVRLAIQKLKSAGIIKTKRMSRDRLNLALFYSFSRQAGFFASRGETGRIRMLTSEAQKWGFCGAVLLYSFRFWINDNEGDEDHWFDGLCWHYDSLVGLARLYRGIFSYKQLKTALSELVGAGVILKRVYNREDGRDPRRWFTVVATEIAPVPKGQSPVPEGQAIGPERADHQAAEGTLSLYGLPYSLSSAAPQKGAQINIEPTTNAFAFVEFQVLDWT